MQHFLAVEPNIENVKELKRRVANSPSSINILIDERYFDENYKQENLASNFDLILMVHSIYYMDRIAEVVAHAKTFLNPKGKLVLFVHEDACYGLSNSETLATIDGCRNPHFFTSLSVSDELKRIAIEHEMIHFPHFRKMRVDDEEVISFALYTEYTALDEDLKMEISEMFKAKAVCCDGKGMMDSCGMITVVNS